MFDRVLRCRVGLKWSEERLKKLSKVICQLDLDGNLIQEWPSIHEASRQTGAGRKEIKRCANGEMKMTKGFKWKFKEHEETI